MLKISIIVPVYNVEKYIIRCLNSVSNQTYKGEIECILVDDCGQDNSLKICREFVDHYNGTIEFKIIRREKNGGLSAARNTGIDNAMGHYLYFLDSDDEITKDSIELFVSEVIKHPGIDVVMGFMHDDRMSDYYNLDCYKDHQYIIDPAWLQFNLLKEGKSIPVNGCNKLLRKDFITNNNLYFKTGIIHEDDHWMFYVMKYVKTWAFVFDSTYIRYWNEGSIMTTLNKEKEERNWIKIMLDHSAHFYEPFYKLQLARYMNKYFGQWMFLPRYPESKILHRNFINASIKMHLWKGAFLLVLWRLLYVVCDGFLAKKWLMEYSRDLFQEESKRWECKYGV